LVVITFEIQTAIGKFELPALLLERKINHLLLYEILIQSMALQSHAL
jgi:hypothetical protein